MSDTIFDSNFAIIQKRFPNIGNTLAAVDADHLSVETQGCTLVVNQIQLTSSYDREKEAKTVELEKNANVKELLVKMNINPVTVIVSRNNNIILEDKTLKDNDDIKIIDASKDKDSVFNQIKKEVDEFL